MNGYLADASGSEDESLQEVRIVRANRTTIEATGRTHISSPKRSRKRRAPGSMLVKGPVVSPIHPDINYRWTKHVLSKDFPDAGGVVSQSSFKRRKTLPSLMQQLSIPATSVNTGLPTGSPSHKSPTSSELQQKTTIIPFERVTATFSKRQRHLEEGLALTQIPRLLIEGESPYRVVHANAAFTQAIIGTASNIQRWFARQTSPNIPRTRGLKKALREIIPKRDVDIVIYPVAGKDKVTHYLIETKDERWTQRKRTTHDEPHIAIG